MERLTSKKCRFNSAVPFLSFCSPVSTSTKFVNAHMKPKAIVMRPFWKCHRVKAVELTFFEVEMKLRWESPKTVSCCNNSDNILTCWFQLVHKNLKAQVSIHLDLLRGTHERLSCFFVSASMLPLSITVKMGSHALAFGYSCSVLAQVQESLLLEPFY